MGSAHALQMLAIVSFSTPSLMTALAAHALQMLAIVSVMGMPIFPVGVAQTSKRNSERFLEDGARSFNQAPNPTLSYLHYLKNAEVMDRELELQSLIDPSYNGGYSYTELLSTDEVGRPRYLTLPLLADSNEDGIADVIRDFFEAAAGDCGTPVVAQAEVEMDLKASNERYAQAGIELSWTITTADPPAGVDLANGLTEFTTPGTLSAEETALLTSSLTTPTTDDLQIFYVNYFSPAPGSIGEAFRESLWGAPLGGNIIETSQRGRFSVAHELGHILKDNGGHSGTTIHVMRNGGTSITNTLGASKRFTTGEVTTMRGSTYAK